MLDLTRVISELKDILLQQVVTSCSHLPAAHSTFQSLRTFYIYFASDRRSRKRLSWETLFQSAMLAVRHFILFIIISHYFKAHHYFYICRSKETIFFFFFPLLFYCLDQIRDFIMSWDCLFENTVNSRLTFWKSHNRSLPLTRPM